MKFSWILLCLMLPLNTALAMELPLPTKPHIIIEGYGAVEKIPDMVKINFEVSATQKDLVSAKKIVDETVGKAILALQKHKITDEQINASKIQAQPQYKWKNTGREYQGEMVSRQVEITLTNAESYNAVVDALLGAGISRIQNVNMDFSDRDALENQAMNRALKSAQTQAKNITSALNKKLAGIFQIAPVGQPTIMRHLEMKAMSADAGAQSVGLTPGKQKVEQRVRVVYLLK